MSSCANSDPEIGATFYSLIYDYTQDEENYDLRLSVFVLPSSDFRRFDTMQVCNQETGFTWKIAEPAVVKSGKNTYYGYRNLRWQGSDDFPDGVYNVSFLDKAGREAKSNFSLVKLKSMVDANGRKAKANEVQFRKAGTECAVKKIALFDDVEMEVFCGLYDENFDNNKTLLGMFPDASTEQIIFTTNDSSVVILMPKETIAIDE